jgi:hypothetical protein
MTGGTWKKLTKRRGSIAWCVDKSQEQNLSNCCVLAAKIDKKNATGTLDNFNYSI